MFCPLIDFGTTISSIKDIKTPKPESAPQPSLGIKCDNDKPSMVHQTVRDKIMGKLMPQLTLRTPEEEDVREAVELLNKFRLDFKDDMDKMLYSPHTDPNLYKDAREYTDKLKNGVKYDGDKLRYDLISPTILEDIAKVLTFGARKYAPDNWKKVPDGKDRYYAAAMRHLQEIRKGNLVDDESGLPHTGHLMCCIMFLDHFTKQNGEVNAVE